MKLSVSNKYPALRETAPYVFGAAILFLAGYGAGNILAPVSKIVF
ncbi:hypothetical protein [Altererythrobacter aquiaggeris]